MKIHLFLIILIFSVNLDLFTNCKRVWSEAYSYAGSSQAFASSSAGAGAFASSSAGAGAFAGFPNTATSVSSSAGPNQKSSSSSSSSSMRNVNGKTSYKIETSMKTNNDPEIKTKIQSDDINKKPKEEISIGGKNLKKQKFKNNNQRKQYKLSVFFLKNLLRILGYKKKFVEKCMKDRRPDVIKNAIDIVHRIGKHQKGYHDVGKLNGLCKGLNDIPLKLNNEETMKKVKKFINHNI